MRLFFRLLLVMLLLNTQVLAQKNGMLKGTAYDILTRQAVASATITILQKKDSALVTFTMTDNSGRFQVTGLANGEYRLMISHVNYHNTNQYFSITDDTRTADLGNIVMNDKNTVLSEVVVQSEAPPVTLIGDTIQYNAGSFKVQPNGSVEQLLKKLPGMEVTKDGSIKAQGETVNKVLVDGKEFFGSDPKIATRNLPADAVDKVQVYERMSDQSQLTGFDDGNSEKTINLKLKQDKKKGVFGKATAGTGTNDRYEGKFNVNSFKGARQMSAIGMGNNTNSEGFSFMDILNFTGELSRMRRMAGGGGGRIEINISGADASLFGAGGNGTGINTTFGGGFNYNNIIGKKTDFQSNYFYNRYNPQRETHTQRTYLLQDSSYFYNSNSFSDNLNNNHRLNLSADIYFDSLTSIKITPSISYQKTNNRSYSDYRNLSQEMVKSLEGTTDNQSNNEGYNFRNELLFRRKFHRKGRTFSIGLQTSVNQNDGNGSLQSLINFYNTAGGIDSSHRVDQRNDNSSNLFAYNARIVYTEPLFKRSLMEFSVSNSKSTNKSDKTTYDFNTASNKYDILNDVYSNNYENEYGYTSAGFRLRSQQKNYNYSVGVNWQKADLQGTIISGTKDSVIRKSFTNLLPNLRFQYNFNRFKNLTLTYSAYTNQPSVSQLQPLPDNSDPLYIRNGNPDLKQEYTHGVQLNFVSINPFKNKNLFAFLTFGETQNKIVSYDSLHSNGVRETRPVNVDGVINANANISVGLPIRFLRGTINIGTRTGYNKSKQFINSVANTIKTLSVGPNIRFDINPSEKLNIGINGNLSYYQTRYSLQSMLNNTYFSQEYGADFGWELPADFYLSSDFTYTINTQRATGFNTNVPLWSASISKQFLKFKRGELKLSGFDLLNQNVGITRSTNQNYIEDTRVLNLRRFFLLSFTYSLTKNGLSNDRGGNRIMIRN